MKTLQECKDEVAKKHGLTNWENACFVWAGFVKQVDPFMDEAAKLYSDQQLEAYKAGEAMQEYISKGTNAAVDKSIEWNEDRKKLNATIESLRVELESRFSMEQVYELIAAYSISPDMSVEEAKKQYKNLFKINVEEARKWIPERP